LRHGGERLGAGTRPIYRTIRAVSGWVEADRALDGDIAAVTKLIDQRAIPVLS
jgi:histidine ammonia-lyase